MDVPQENRPAVPRDWTRGVPERYVAGGVFPERSRRNTRGGPEGRPYPRSQQVIHETSELTSKDIGPDIFAIVYRGHAKAVVSEEFFPEPINV
jgi:hypothetical protein